MGHVPLSASAISFLLRDADAVQTAEHGYATVYRLSVFVIMSVCVVQVYHDHIWLEYFEHWRQREFKVAGTKRRRG